MQPHAKKPLLGSFCERHLVRSLCCMICVCLYVCIYIMIRPFEMQQRFFPNLCGILLELGVEISFDNSILGEQYAVIRDIVIRSGIDVLPTYFWQPLCKTPAKNVKVCTFSPCTWLLASACLCDSIVCHNCHERSSDGGNFCA